MVKNVLSFFRREVEGLHEAAYLMGGFALLSQLLALIRDRLFAGTFGAGETLDIYYAAFRIPDFILITGASLVSVSILIPFLIEKIEKEQDSARRFIDSVFTVFFAGIIILSAIAFFIIPILIPILFPGFEGETVERAVLLIRILLLQPILLGLSNLFASVTQVYKKFFVYALSPILYNIGIIAGVVFLYPKIGISGLAWGAVLGAFLHFLVQVPVVFEKGLTPRFTFAADLKVVGKVMLVSLPRTLALSANNIAVLLLFSIASFMGAGAIAVFNLAWNLQSVPLAIVGASYSIAAFPTLSRLFSSGDRAKFLAHLETAIRHILFWSLPATALFIVLRAQIVRTILGFGEFDWSDTKLTAACLALFALSAAAQSLTVLFISAYYARSNTITPLVINVVSSSLIVLLGYLMVYAFGNVPSLGVFVSSTLRVENLRDAQVLALPLAYSIATIFNAVLFWIFFQRDFSSFSRKVWMTLGESIVGALAIGAGAYVLLNLLAPFFNLNTAIGIFSQGLIAGLGAVAFGIIVLALFKNSEQKEIWKTLHSKIWKAKVVAIEQEKL